MNTESIIEGLSLYNRWRRGDKAVTAPDPKQLGELIDAAVTSLRSLIASNTTLRRERREAREEVSQLKAALSRVTEGIAGHRAAIDAATKEAAR